MKGKFTAVLFIIVFILIAAVVFTFLSSLDRNRDTEGTANVGGTVSVAPAASETTPFAAPTASQPPAAIVTPAPTPAPVQTAVPTAAPVPTPLPTTVPTTAPVQTTLASGSFSSQTGTWLNITADWSAQSLNQEQVQVTVSVSAVSYALQTQALPRSVNIGLDGQYLSLDAPAINYTGAEQVISALGTQSFTVDLPANSSRALALQVEWQFNGVYGGPNGSMELPVIECGGTINISR